MYLKDVTIQWTDVNMIEKGHRIYRSHSPMDVDNLPEPIANLERNSTEYIDKDRVIGETLYYRVSAWIDGYEAISDEVVIEVKGIPGPQSLMAGDLETGFYGEVGPDDFISYGALSTLVGLSAGTLHNHDESLWLKFSMDGSPVYVAKQSIRHTISWNHINAQNLVFGRTVEIGDYQYTVRLMTGLVNPNTYTAGGEWNRLLYPIASSQDSLGWGVNIPDADLGVASGNGFASWTQERDPRNTSRRAHRGNSTVKFLNAVTSSDTSSYTGWRPILVPQL